MLQTPPLEINIIFDVAYVYYKSSWNRARYAIVPTIANISNDLQYLCANLAQLPSLKEIFLGFTLMNICSPTWNYL